MELLQNLEARLAEAVAQYPNERMEATRILQIPSITDSPAYGSILRRPQDIFLYVHAQFRLWGMPISVQDNDVLERELEARADAIIELGDLLWVHLIRTKLQDEGRCSFLTVEGPRRRSPLEAARRAHAELEDHSNDYFELHLNNYGREMPGAAQAGHGMLTTVALLIRALQDPDFRTEDLHSIFAPCRPVAPGHSAPVVPAKFIHFLCHFFRLSRLEAAPEWVQVLTDDGETEFAQACIWFLLCLFTGTASEIRLDLRRCHLFASFLAFTADRNLGDDLGPFVKRFRRGPRPERTQRHRDLADQVRNMSEQALRNHQVEVDFLQWFEDLEEVPAAEAQRWNLEPFCAWIRRQSPATQMAATGAGLLTRHLNQVIHIADRIAVQANILYELEAK